MSTNLLTLLQGSPAYQAAALSLMLSQVNTYVERLDLPILRPVEPSHLIERYVTPPKFGMGGALRTTNYTFTFSMGHLHTVSRGDILHGQDYREELQALSKHSSLVDSNGAYQLATQWLTAVCVDVPALERACAPRVVQRCYSSNPYPPDMTLPANTLYNWLPIFDIEWRPCGAVNQHTGSVTVAVLGHTKELLNLDIGTVAFSSEAALAITNLGETYAASVQKVATNAGTYPYPWRRPRYAPPLDLPTAQQRPWLEAFFSRHGSLEPLKDPDKVEAYLFNEYDSLKVMQPSESLVALGPVPVKTEIARNLADLVLDFGIYAWELEGFAPEYRVRIRFSKGTNTVEVLVNNEQDCLQVRVNGHGGPDLTCLPAQARMADFTQKLFPFARFKRPD